MSRTPLPVGNPDNRRGTRRMDAVPVDPSVIEAVKLGVVTGPDLDPPTRDAAIDVLDAETCGGKPVYTVAQIARKLGCTVRTVQRRRIARVFEAVCQGRTEPGSPMPYQPGWVVGTCGHRVYRQAWGAGVRVCEPGCEEAWRQGVEW